MNAYRERLEREFASLRQQRVAIRRKLEWFARGHQLGDMTDTMNTVRQLQAMLKGTDREWQTLCVQTGRESMLNPPVKLDAAPRTRVQQPVRLASRATTRAVPGGYLTRALFPSK